MKKLPVNLGWLGLALFCCFGILYFAYQSDVENQTKQNEQRKRITRLLQQFDGEVARAKRATSDPCASVFYELVTPPAETQYTPVLVMMGNEVSSTNSPLDPSSFQLRSVGGRVELWTSFIAAQRYGEASRTWTKIGEKFAPDSKECKIK